MQMPPDFEEEVDVVVVGPGSSGCAAALARLA
jgi:flavin-dependent dehydrogenase